MSLKVQDPDMFSNNDGFENTRRSDDITVDSVKEQLAEEEARRKNFQTSGMYVEAEMARSRIVDLKEREFRLNYEQTLINHKLRQEEMNSAHMAEYRRFNHEQDLKLQGIND